MRRGSVSVCAAAALAWGLAVEAKIRTGQAPALKAPLPALAPPDGEGKALVERVCGGCHDPSLVMFTREDEEGWAASGRPARAAAGTGAAAARG